MNRSLIAVVVAERITGEFSSNSWTQLSVTLSVRLCNCIVLTSEGVSVLCFEAPRRADSLRQPQEKHPVYRDIVRNECAE